MWMDILDGGPLPRRGDRLRSSKTTYFVLHARQVKRRDPKACPRAMMKVAKLEELEESTRAALIRSAIRGHDASILFNFRWHPREKKRKSFEQLMAGR